MVSNEQTYVYLVGLSQIRDPLDELSSKLHGAADSWAKMKAELIEQRRCVELLYRSTKRHIRCRRTSQPSMSS
jgi:hypothetical protein